MQFGTGPNSFFLNFFFTIDLINLSYSHESVDHFWTNSSLCRNGWIMTFMRVEMTGEKCLSGSSRSYQHFFFWTKILFGILPLISSFVLSLVIDLHMFKLKCIFELSSSLRIVVIFWRAVPFFSSSLADFDRWVEMFARLFSPPHVMDRVPVTYRDVTASILALLLSIFICSSQILFFG